MSLYKFEQFIFDSTSYSLSNKGQKVTIRPKALKLLKLLIQNRHRIVSKAEIMSSVWGSGYARDHLLFQLIGELRKSPLKSEFVRTQPNEGYQWNVPTKVIKTPIFAPRLIAASFIVALVCVSVLVMPALQEAQDSSAQLEQLPAYGALSKGIVALESGDKIKAIEWFEFALAENPESVESSVFLAETLYQQNRPEESSVHLMNVLNKENLSAYNKASATNLLSRIHEQQGRYDDALRYAQSSSKAAVIGQCSVDFVEQRMNMLENELGHDEVAMTPVQTDHEQAEPEDDSNLAKDYADHCQQLKDKPIETSSCRPQPLRREEGTLIHPA
jgi:DNA-binding winged helix-turn-helix (wHTH) protein